MSTRSLVYWIALVGGAELGLRGYLADDLRLFHVGAWLFAAMLAGTAWHLRSRAPIRAAIAGVTALLSALLSVLAWAGVPADTPNPLVDFWEQHGIDRRVLSTIVERGPVTLFGQEIPLDAEGFRRDVRAPRPQRAFRIVALGGSTTFGATQTKQEHPWPALLQQRIDALDCAMPVKVVNAGRIGRALGGSIQDFDRELRLLRPDLVIYYPAPQDIAGLMDEVREDVTPEAAVPARASALLRRLEQSWREHGVERRFRAAVRAEPPPLDLDAVRVTSTYRRFLLQMRRKGIEVALATGSLAVNGDTPEARIRLHDRIDPRTRRMVLANRFHARFVRGLAASYRARLIDTRPGLDGEGALFIDLFHLTEAGRERLADNILAGLLPLLGADPPGCTPHATAGGV
jgi:lysophospholipase L1-like esterase